ncbi:MAG TPA: hypothetical protein VMZ27_00220 [Candidatus Saccharimonadales bacterium]|nr:hypothetical protein [Candidatus Saccharimonadales bacterium]
MKSGNETKTPVVMDLAGPSRLRLSNPSAKIVLTLLFLLSLNAVACYDSTLSICVRLTRVVKTFSVHALLLLLGLAREASECLARRWP